MSEKNVDYSSITVNINTIYQKLHAAAIGLAEKKNPAIKIENLAFTDADDPKQAKLIGSGQYRIIGGMKDEDAEVLSREKFAEVFQEYTSWFCGKEEASYIKEQMLAPIYKSEDSSSDEDDQPNQENGNSSSDGEEKGKNEVSESFHSRQEENLLGLLFEAEEEDKDDKEKPQDGKNGSDGDEKPDEKGKEERKSDQKLIGYSIGYDISINNKKEHTWFEGAKTWGDGFFGQALADLRNISITWNGGKLYNIGKWLDPAKWKEAAGYIDIDKNRIPSNMKNALNHDFDSNDADVRCMAGNTLNTYLSRKGKLTPTIKAKIGSTKYSVVIGVNSNDPNYPRYNQESIARSATKAFGTAKGKLRNTNEVTGDDVIKIENVESLYKRNSSYDEKAKYDVRDRASDGRSPEVSKTSSTPQTTKSANVPTRSTVTEEETKKKEKDKNEVEVKEDTDLEKLVKSDEYKNFVSKILEEQCNLELKDDEHTCKYGSTEDITNEMMEKGVNDLELLRKIKTAGIQSYLVTVTKNLQTAVNEALEEARGLLKALFEDVDQTEDLVEAEEEATKEKVLNSNIDTTNITGDPKIDNGLKEKSKKNVKVIIKKDKIESQVVKKAERVIRNTIIKALDQFKTDRTFEEFDTDCFCASVEKEMENLSESLEQVIRNYVYGHLNEDIETEAKKKVEGKPVAALPEFVERSNDELFGAVAHAIENAKENISTIYAACAPTPRVVEYLKKHGVGDAKCYSEIEKLPYCAIVIAKRSMEVDGETILGQKGNKALTDQSVNAVLNRIFGSKNKLPTINCKTQNKDMMDNVKGDLFEKSLSFRSERGSSEKHVPELDVWLRPFEVEDKKTKPLSLDTTIQWFVVLPDPIPVEKEDKEEKKDGSSGKNGGDSKNSGDLQEDWYIIPHKSIKDLGDRPHQETHDAKGITRTKTSDDEYRAS